MEYKKLSFLILILASELSFSQNQKIQIAFLGVFHFGQSTDYQQGTIRDLLSDKRQAEIQEVVEALAKFSPDKIYVENTPDYQRYWERIYEDWLRGIKPKDFTAEYNEIFQIGIKLAKQINHPFGVSCINFIQPDLNSGLKTARNKTDTLNIFYAHELERFRPNYNDYFQANPSVKKSLETYIFNHENWKKLSIKEHLRKLNEKESLASLHYFNITGWMDTNTNGYGAEFSAKEYYRNTKILQNLYFNLSPTDKKLLVIIGGGHVQVLQDMIKSHPYFELVEINEILK